MGEWVGPGIGGPALLEAAEKCQQDEQRERGGPDKKKKREGWPDMHKEHFKSKGLRWAA